jgi:hypothetical protein
LTHSSLCYLSRIPSSYSFSGAGSSTRPKIKKRRLQRPRDDEEIESEEEVILPPKSRRQLFQEAKATHRQVKEAELRAKKVDKWSKHDFITMRMKNPYTQPRNPRVLRNPFFYSPMQERVFNEVYGKKKVRLAPMHSIDIAHMDKTPEYFGEAKALCEEYGLLPLMEFNHVLDEAIVAQFCATVHLSKTGDRELIWMTRDKLMKTTWAKFGECLGYPAVDDPTPVGLFHVHIERRPMAKSNLAPLYIPGWGPPGNSKYLLPVYDIMHCIYQKVFNPKVGNVDQIHGFMIDLMLLTHQNRGSGLQLDVMDFLWHEFQWGLCHKKSPPLCSLYHAFDLCLLV